MDRYLASLRAASPVYEDPYAQYGGGADWAHVPVAAQPLPLRYTDPAYSGALQDFLGGGGGRYGTTAPVARPDTTGWAGDVGYGIGHTPVGMPPPGAPPPVNTGPGGPRPSTPTGTILPGGGGWDLGRFYNAANDRASGAGGENALGRFNRWVNDTLNVARSRGVAVNPDDVKEIARGGIKYAEEHGFGPTGFDFTGAQSNTLNPGQAVDFLAAGRRPNAYHTDARGLTIVPGQGGADPYQAAADHVTQALSGGTAGGQTMATPGYDPGLGGGTAGVPRAGGGGGVSIPGLGSLTSDQALYLLSDPAAFQAYIASAAGAPIGNQSFRSQFLRGQIVPTVQAAIESLTGLGGETTTDQLGQNIQKYLGMLGGRGGFGALRGEATSALGNPELWGNLGLLKDQEAAQRLNQIVGLATAGSGDLYGSAMRQRGLNALEQKHLSDMSVPIGQTAPTYSDYFQQLPWVQTLRGGR